MGNPFRHQVFARKRLSLSSLPPHRLHRECGTFAGLPVDGVVPRTWTGQTPENEMRSGALNLDSRRDLCVEKRMRLSVGHRQVLVI